MAKFLLINLIGLLLCLNFITYGLARECPNQFRITTCTPRCFRDNDCTNGGKCCSDSCNQKSCVAPHLLRDGGSKYDTRPRYDSSSVYCGNVKCGPFEKCAIDRYTKRERCVRG